MRLIVGVSGATGVVMSERLLQALRQTECCETHLVVTEGARRTWQAECARPIQNLFKLADFEYDPADMAAGISSGTFQTDGMIVLPASMKTVAGIANGFAENLLLRAADVSLKEGRKVVLVPRETPLSRIHLRNLLTAAEMGCIILPPMLSFYNEPQTLTDEVDHIIGKILMQFALPYEAFHSWKGTSR